MKDDASDSLVQSPWFHIHSVDSTNKFLMMRPDAEILDGMTCTADIQTEGMGRRNRTWVSPLGGLYMSIVLRPKIDQKYWHLTSFVMGVAAAESIAASYPDLNPRLKWPNDILVNHSKIAGILVQSKSFPSPRLVVGIGVNVATNPQFLPDRPLFPTGVLNNMSCFSMPVHKLASAIRAKFLFYIAKWYQNPHCILQKWELYSATQGAQVKIKTDQTEYTGLCCGLSDDGGLHLDVENCSMVFYSGDILAIVGEKS